MARTARSVHARKKRRKVLEQAKGYRGTKHSSYKRAKEQVWKSGVYAYQGRKQRKRDFRSLWIQRINAGSREHGMSYSQLIHGLRLPEIDLDRQIPARPAATPGLLRPRAPTPAPASTACPTRNSFTACASPRSTSTARSWPTSPPR